MSLNPATLVTQLVVGIVWLVVLAAAPVRAQVPWITFEDSDSASVCNVVNAEGDELVVLDATGQLVIVTGTDLILEDSFVDFDGSVIFEGFSAGFITFATDADGFRTLWWLADTGEVMRLNAFFRPTLSDFLPGDFSGVPCDACPLWDDASACDADLDGVFDFDDLCPITPFDEAADVFGCSCSQADEDADGIDDCHDLCPNTFNEPNIDIDGCIIPSGGGNSVVFCGAVGIPTLALMFTGLMLTGTLRGSSGHRNRGLRRRKRAS